MKFEYHVLGIMSGTSLDGIDLAQCEFTISESGEWFYTFGKTETVPYTEAWQLRLKEAVHFSEGRLISLNVEYTSYLAEVISAFITKHKINQLDAICSHGHTILHRPDKGRTLQIGNLPQLAKMLKQTVVCDFRVQDVAMGGQGAPLVPIGDKLLFSDYDYCLNLGGFANVSFDFEGERIAYDICPVNIVLNSFAAELGNPYDAGGELARSGTVNPKLLQALNSLPFYGQHPPKSLGFEWVSEHVLPLTEHDSVLAEDKLASFTEHVAFQLARQLKEGTNVLVTGGGAYNTFLLERLKIHRRIRLELPSPQLIEYKEALVFGLLGVLKLRGENNCLATVTGAANDHSSGEIYQSIRDQNHGQ